MKLKELREKSNITQTEFAKAINIKQQYVSRYEKRIADPDIATLIKTADYFGVSLDYLCDHKTSTYELPPLNEDLKQFLDMVFKLNQTNFVKAYSFVAGLYAGQ